MHTACQTAPALLELHIIGESKKFVMQCIANDGETHSSLRRRKVGALLFVRIVFSATSDHCDLIAL